MVEQLRMFSSELNRVTVQVGTEGKLDAQAILPYDLDGIWRDLTVSLNTMSMNLTAQMRDISKVFKAVARGDLTQKVTVDSHGEIHELKVYITLPPLPPDSSVAYIDDFLYIFLLFTDMCLYIYI